MCDFGATEVHEFLSPSVQISQGSTLAFILSIIHHGYHHTHLFSCLTGPSPAELRSDFELKIDPISDVFSRCFCGPKPILQPSDITPWCFGMIWNICWSCRWSGNANSRSDFESKSQNTSLTCLTILLLFYWLEIHPTTFQPHSVMLPRGLECCYQIYFAREWKSLIRFWAQTIKIRYLSFSFPGHSLHSVM